MDIARVASLAMALPLVGCAYGSIETTEATSSAVTADGQRHLRANVSGLLGGGLVLTDAIAGTVSVGGDGVVVFPNAIDAGTAYAVTITDPPIGPRQSCTVGAGDGVAGEDDPVVNVTCAAPTFTVGGHVSGVSSVGLVLEDNGAEPIALSTDGTFRFATSLPIGASYLVTVAQQPSGQTCQIYFASGTIASDDVENIEVVCAESKRPLAGSVRGVDDASVLLANGDDVLSVHGSGRFTMPAPVSIGAGYDLVIAEQPAGVTCTVTGGRGKMTSDPADVVVDCATNLPSETDAAQ
jgi:hypothetical protein